MSTSNSSEVPATGPWGSPQPEPKPVPPAPPAPRQHWAWTLVSSVIFAAFLWWRMGWMWALAAMVGVFVHEYGHVLAINAAGSGPGRIHVVPFFGGAATMARPPQSEFKSVLIALAGPAFGLIAAVPFFAAAWTTGDAHWFEGAFFIAAINLLNLVPAPPLDGSKALGPVLGRIHPMLERAVLVAIGAAAALWAVTHGEWLLAMVVGVTIGSSLTAPRLRPPTAPLAANEILASLALYVAAVMICLAVLQGATDGLGLPNPLAILGRFGA
ncbi:MAG TPA: M50 family metallopeptidase [Caulobacteraceae bacterium]|nr:M50 family metallopeptidase [Caulobacteraceae bacterium]